MPAVSGGLMSIQVYGHFSDYGSFANVSRAMVRVLKRRGLSGQVFHIHTLTPSYHDVAWPVGFQSAAPVGIFIGYPEASVGYLKGHQHKVLVTVCESSKIPPTWVEAANQATLVVVPSMFCETTFKTSGVKTRILVAPHGIDDLAPYVEVASEPRQGTRLLHVSGALSFPQRKGTSQLLLAMRKIHAEHPEVALHLRMHRTPGVERAIERLSLQGIVLIDEEPCIGPIAMTRHLMGFDAVVQPSRGEGFGIVPVEARCAGVPVVMTTVTGHAMHFVPGVDIPIATPGSWEPLATQGNDYGLCPPLDVGHVATGLQTLLQDLPAWQTRAREWASRHAVEWTWSRVLGPFTKQIASMTKDAPPSRFGQEAGLRGQ